MSIVVRLHNRFTIAFFEFRHFCIFRADVARNLCQFVVQCALYARFLFIVSCCDFVALCDPLLAVRRPGCFSVSLHHRVFCDCFAGVYSQFGENGARSRCQREIEQKRCTHEHEGSGDARVDRVRAADNNNDNDAMPSGRC